MGGTYDKSEGRVIPRNVIARFGCELLQSVALGLRMLARIDRTMLPPPPPGDFKIGASLRLLLLLQCTEGVFCLRVQSWGVASAAAVAAVGTVAAVHAESALCLRASDNNQKTKRCRV